MNNRGKVYRTRHGNVRVRYVPGIGRVITDPKGNVLRVKATSGGK